ncbi:tetratricopeptide repeat protein [Olleya namhaensis]|uniref:tetratricopeptide repeat protein n=1 Tax=Olleya namhaensis TaxID=1144750 RepID=UPI0024926F06|nr:hypothetical protein [Olleya namhaensis]
MKRTLIVLFLILVACKENQNSNTNKNTDFDLSNTKKGTEQLQAGNSTLAIEYFNKVINNTELNSTNFIVAEAYIGRATAKGELGDERGAISDLTKVINTSNVKHIKAQAYFLRGVGYSNMNETDSACYDWSKAGELGISKAYEYIREDCN